MNWQNFNTADFVILAILGISVIVSFLRGFVKEALSLTVWILAIWVAYRFAGIIANHYLTMIQPANGRPILAFVIIVLSVLLLGSFVNYIIGQFITKTGLTGMDRILGLAFGFARGILLIAVLVLAAQMTVIPKKPWWEKSQIIPQFQVLSEWLKGYLPEQFDKIKATMGEN